MLRKVPPLEATEAFLVAANARSFRVAAAGLALSPSAFSRRIQLLERFVGVELFHRTSSSSHLTVAGRAYLTEIGPAIETIRTATIALRERNRERRVRIATSHSLASEWLLPRLPSLIATHGIEVDVMVSRDAQLLRDRVVDLGIWGGTGSEPGIISELAASMDGVPACAALLANGSGPPGSVDELGDHRLLSDQVSRSLWPRWLEKAGYRGARPRIDDHFETNQLCNEAAASGLGITLCLPMVAERFIESRRLVACAPLRIPVDAAYHVHSLAPPQRGSTTATVIDWLLSEAETSLRRFNAWWADAAHSPRVSC